MRRGSRLGDEVWVREKDREKRGRETKRKYGGEKGIIR